MFFIIVIKFYFKYFFTNIKLALEELIHLKPVQHSDYSNYKNPQYYKPNKSKLGDLPSSNEQDYREGHHPYILAHNPVIKAQNKTKES